MNIFALASALKQALFPDNSKLLKAVAKGYVLCFGETVPTDGDSGFAKGCLWVKTNGSAGTLWYINVGSETSCDFDACDVTLATLAGTGGAALVGALDAGGYFSGTTVEAILQELKDGTLTQKFNDNVAAIFGTGSDVLLDFDSARAVLDLNRAGVGLAGFRGLSDRYELLWIAGQRGKPGVNGDIQSATEATRMIADPDFEIQGLNGTSALCTFDAEGGVLLTTDTGSGDQMILVPHADANQSAWGQITWGTDREVIWETRIRTQASIADITLWAGLKLTSTPAIATDDDQIYFRFNPSEAGGDWQAVSSIGGSDDAHDTSVAVAADTTYHLMIKIAADRTAQFYINGALVETSAALTDTTDLIPFVGVQTDTTAAKALQVYGQAASRVAA